MSFVIIKFDDHADLEFFFSITAHLFFDQLFLSTHRRLNSYSTNLPNCFVFAPDVLLSVCMCVCMYICIYTYVCVCECARARAPDCCLLSISVLNLFRLLAVFFCWLCSSRLLLLPLLLFNCLLFRLTTRKLVFVVFFFPFHTSVLKPDLDLPFSQS